MRIRILLGILAIPLCILGGAFVLYHLNDHSKMVRAASEILPTVATWSKLCDEYVYDNGVPCEGFASLEFRPPGATNPVDVSESRYFRYVSEAGRIMVTSKVDMDHCPQGSTWTAWLVFHADSSYHFQRRVTPETCLQYTPKFMKYMETNLQ